MIAPKYFAGARVTVRVDETWVGPAADQLKGRPGVVTEVDTITSATAIFGVAYFVRFDQPLDLGWRSLDGLWFNEVFLEERS